MSPEMMRSVEGFAHMAPVLAPTLGAVVVKLYNGLWVEKLSVRKFGRTHHPGLERATTVWVNPQKDRVVVPSGGSVDIQCFHDPKSISIDDVLPNKMGEPAQHGYARVSYGGKDLTIRYMKDTMEINEDIVAIYRHPRDPKSRAFHGKTGSPLLTTEFHEQNPYHPDGKFAQEVKKKLRRAFRNIEGWIEEQVKRGYKREDLSEMVRDPWKLQTFVEVWTRQATAARLQAKSPQLNFSDEKWLEIVDAMLKAGQL